MGKLKKKKAGNAASRDNKAVCRHDYKNAIQIGNVDWERLNNLSFNSPECEGFRKRAGLNSFVFGLFLKNEFIYII